MTDDTSRTFDKQADSFRQEAKVCERVRGHFGGTVIRFGDLKSHEFCPIDCVYFNSDRFFWFEVRSRYDQTLEDFERRWNSYTLIPWQKFRIMRLVARLLKHDVYFAHYIVNDDIVLWKPLFLNGEATADWSKQRKTRNRNANDHTKHIEWTVVFNFENAIRF